MNRLVRSMALAPLCVAAFVSGTFAQSATPGTQNSTNENQSAKPKLDGGAGTATESTTAAPTQNSTNENASAKTPAAPPSGPTSAPTKAAPTDTKN